MSTDRAAVTQGKATKRKAAQQVRETPVQPLLLAVSVKVDVA